MDSDYDSLGRLSGKTFPGGSQSFSYDARNRLKSASQTMDGHTTGIEFDYDRLGDRIDPEHRRPHLDHHLRLRLSERHRHDPVSLAGAGDDRDRQPGTPERGAAGRDPAGRLQL
ncbi:MAG: hypothetical protein GY801_02675 [bacterium]|nr:hypothetical protein [bacterium]